MRVKAGQGVLATIFWCLLIMAYPALSGAGAPDKADKESILAAYANLPLYFIENKGQLDPKVRFYVKTSGQTLYFTDEKIVFDLFRGGKGAKDDRRDPEKGLHEAGEKREQLVFSLKFENVKEGVLIEGFEPQEAGINYFVGNDKSKWRTGIPTYNGIVYKGVYEGIDLKVFGDGKDMEYEFIVNPGGNSDHILLTYNGIEGLTVNEVGQLLIGTAFGQIEETKPHIYQEIEGKKEVNGRFEIRSSADPSEIGKFSYGFQVASYDPAYPLVIDPTLDYSTYLGGSFCDKGYGIAVDGYGNAYVTGETYSTDFPTKNPFQATRAGGVDAFITKLSSAGNALLYSTYLGGNKWDLANGIAVDSYGNAYVTGFTHSSDFPTKNPFQTKMGAMRDAFITKLSPSGNALSYSTYLGGSNMDEGLGIAVDGSGNAYVTGEDPVQRLSHKEPLSGNQRRGGTMLSSPSFRHRGTPFPTPPIWGGIIAMPDMASRWTVQETPMSREKPRLPTFPRKTPFRHSQGVCLMPSSPRSLHRGTPFLTPHILGEPGLIMHMASPWMVTATLMSRE